VLLGARACSDGGLPLAGTQWAAERRGWRNGGAVPAVDFAAHARVCDLVAGLVARQVADEHNDEVEGEWLVRGVHDVSTGGLGVALAEMAAASGVGAVLTLTDPAELFTELPSRFVVATGDADALGARADDAAIPWAVLGCAGGDRLVVGELADVAVSSLQEGYDTSLAAELGDL
jgi:phosphoribosylformylglycinamidine (FGAM) synthase-like enzyme